MFKPPAPAAKARKRPAAAGTEPRQRDADRAQQTILAAAGDEFHAHGLGGARVERIAERAAVDKNLIGCYVQNRDKPFQAVVEDAPCRWTPPEGAKGVQLVEAALQSGHDRRRVDVPARQL